MQCQTELVGVGLLTKTIKLEALSSFPIPTLHDVTAEPVVPGNTKETQVADTVLLENTASLHTRKRPHLNQ